MNFLKLIVSIALLLSAQSFASPHHGNGPRNSELSQLVRQHVYGNNTVHLRDMFALNQNHYGKSLNYVVLTARSECRNSWQNAQATLRVNDWQTRNMQTLSYQLNSYYFYLNNERIGQELTNVQIDLDCDMYVEEIRVGLNDDHYFPPNPPSHHGNYYFEGLFESTPVQFSGNTHQELFRNCQNKLQRMNLGGVDEVRVFNRYYRNKSNYWYTDSLCALAVLNAKSNSRQSHLALEATVESFPIALEIDAYSNSAEILSSFLWQGIGNMSVDEVWIWGRFYGNRSSYWNFYAVLEMLQNNLR